MKNGKSQRHFRIADQVGCLFADILPDNACAVAVATCQFTVQGPESVGQKAKNWGQWIRTSLKTHGHRPSLDVWQGGRCGMIRGDGHSNADVILNCIGLTIGDVLDHYGTPKVGELYQVDLVDIILALAADLLSVGNVAEVAAA